MRTESVEWAVRGAGLALGAGVVILVGRVLADAIDVLLLVFIAVLLASGFEPVIGTLRAWLGIGRAWTILLVYAIFIAVVVVLVFLVAPEAVRQAVATVQAVPPLLDRASTWASSLQPSFLGSSIGSLVEFGREVIRRPPTPDAQQLVQTGLTVAEVAVSIVTLLVVVFFWLVEHARLQRYVLAFLPPEHRASARDSWNRIETRLGLWVRGQLILMGAIGLATGVVYTVLGLPAALLLAVIAALCEAIPLVGPTLGAIPALLVALSVSPQLALLVLVAYIALHLIEGNVLVPTVMRNTVGLSPFIVLVSLLIGGAIAGIPGAFVAVPIATAVEIALEPLQARELPVAPEPRPDDEPQEEKEREPSLPGAVGGMASR